MSLEVIKSFNSFMAEWTLNIHIFWVKSLHLVSSFSNNRRWKFHCLTTWRNSMFLKNIRLVHWKLPRKIKKWVFDFYPKFYPDFHPEFCVSPMLTWVCWWRCACILAIWACWMRWAWVWAGKRPPLIPISWLMPKYHIEKLIFLWFLGWLGWKGTIGAP